MPTRIHLRSKMYLILFWLAVCCFHQCLNLPRTSTSPGDIIIGGLFNIHSQYDDSTNLCSGVNYQAIQLVQAMIYGIQVVNNDFNLLPNVTLGFKIGDTCDSPEVTFNQAFEMANFDIIDQIYSYVQTSASCSSRCSCQSVPTNHLASTHNDSRSTIRVRPITAVIGADHDDQALVTATVFSTFDIAQISYGSTVSVLSNRYDYKTFFRTVPSDIHQATALIEIVRYFNWTYVAVVAIDNDYGNDLSHRFLRLAKVNQVCVPLYINMDLEIKQQQLKSIVARLKQNTFVTVIILIAYEHHAQQLFDVAQQQQLTGKIFIGSSSWSNAAILQTVDPSILEGGLVISLESSYTKDFYSYLQTLNSTNNVWNPWINQYWRNRPLNETLCKSVDSPSCIPLELFYNIHSKAGYVITAVQALAQALHAMLNCTDHYCPYVDFDSVPVSRLIPYLYNIYIKNISSSWPVFDSKGNGIPYYKIKNVQRDRKTNRLKLVSIGDWNGLEGDCYNNSQGKLICNPKLKLNSENIRWSHNFTWPSVPSSRCSQDCQPGTKRIYDPIDVCCWTCELCGSNQISNTTNAADCYDCSTEQQSSKDKTSCISRPITYVRPTDPLGIAIMVYESLTIIVILIFWIMTFRFRHQIIANTCTASYILDHLLLLSSVGVSSNAIVIIQRLTVINCNILFYLFFMSITFLIAVLMIKALALQYSAQRETARCRVLYNYPICSGLIILLGILIMQGVILFLLHYFLPVIVLKDVADSNVVYIYCAHQYRLRFIIALAILAVVIFVAIIIVKKLLHLVKRFKDIRWIFNSLLMIFIVLSGIIPPYLLLRGPLERSALSFGSISIALTTCVINFAFRICYIDRYNMPTSATTTNILTPSATRDQTSLRSTSSKTDINIGIDNVHPIVVVNTLSNDTRTSS